MTEDDIFAQNKLSSISLNHSLDGSKEGKWALVFEKSNVVYMAKKSFKVLFKADI